MAKTNNSENPPQTGNNEKSDKIYKLAMCIIIFGLSAVTLIGGVAIVAAMFEPQGQRVSSVKDILGVLLPVISAWIGAVIAYYFTKENFKSATDSTSKLFTQFRTTEEKLKAITAREVMIDIGLATKLVMKENQKESEIKLKGDIIDGELEPAGRNRLPILDHQMRPKYVIHRSMIDKFIVQKIAEGKQLSDLNLQHMLDEPAFANILKNSFRTVKETSNLAEVKACIDKEDGCSDVFITEDGGSGSKVIGWITNVIVTKKCVA